MKYYIIAGEASGDLHASHLVKEIKNQDTDALIYAWGGDKMLAQGVNLRKHYKETAYMGFVEVLQNLPAILKNLSFCKKDITAFQPDVLVLVDFPGFNLKIAKFVKKKGLKVVYYISPQLWAWKEGRVNLIKKYVDKMLVIFPFEVDFYKTHGLEVEFVGHPLLDEIGNLIKTENERKNQIVLLPGSRKQEIKKMLPEFLKQTRHFPDYKFIVAAMSSHGEDFYNHLIGNHPVYLAFNKTYQLLAESKAALVTSGTATLETALFRVPQVIAYKANLISYWIGRMLVKVKYIGIVNLLMNKEVVKELIQHDCNELNLQEALNNLLFTEKRTQVLSDYDALIHVLGEKKASLTAAKEIVRVASNKK